MKKNRKRQKARHNKKKVRKEKNKAKKILCKIKKKEEKGYRELRKSPVKDGSD